MNESTTNSGNVTVDTASGTQDAAVVAGSNRYSVETEQQLRYALEEEQRNEESKTGYAQGIVLLKPNDKINVVKTNEHYTYIKRGESDLVRRILTDDFEALDKEPLVKSIHLPESEITREMGNGIIAKSA